MQNPILAAHQPSGFVFRTPAANPDSPLGNTHQRAPVSYGAPVHMIKLTETREITPHLWVHPDEDKLRRPPHLSLPSHSLAS
jgi:hypothetical protein